MLLLIIFILVSFDQSYTPRPKGYFRIDLPDKKFENYNPLNCPFSFELPIYSEVKNYRDSIAEPCWKYIRFPQFDAEIFLSYRKVNNNVAAFVEDARTLAYKHTVKATTIDETAIHTTSNVSGMVYDIGGNAASAIQLSTLSKFHPNQRRVSVLQQCPGLA